MVTTEDVVAGMEVSEMVAAEDAVAGMEVSQSQMVAAQTALKLRQTRQNVPSAHHAERK
jgi:hypothetical protein